MRKYVFISIGGILGAISRYLIKGLHIYHYHENVPLNTLIINVTGSFILALVLTVAFEVWEFDASIRLGIATGFLGAYTTFSTLCKETVGLIHQGDYFSAITYITDSTIVGIAAAYFGIVLAREVVSKLVKKDKEDLEENMVEEIEGGVE
ncbi:MAG: fluoride efflux transporter CrcB [Clostridiales bacterium]|jgi:CrcB protein|nr:fluoride efflux transporter CrcB [Eubacteriales bacterium]MDH7567467.1 fluoride efflux transporter CrcB [Clostridiales bacterium]